jgi:hypothetical protein
MGSMALSKYCFKQNTIPLTNKQIKNSLLLKHLNAQAGQTPKELGFGFYKNKN